MKGSQMKKLVVEYKGSLYSKRMAVLRGKETLTTYKALEAKYKGKADDKMLAAMSEVGMGLDDLRSDLEDKVDELDNVTGEFTLKGLDKLPKDVAKFAIELRRTVDHHLSELNSAVSDLESITYLADDLKPQGQPVKAPRKIR